MRRPGNAPFIDVRRLGGNSTFVAVHEPYSDTPNVRSLRVVPLDEASVGAVVLEIQLADGVDTFASTLDPSGYEDGDGSVKAFRITPSERREEQTRLYVDGDPGMALMPDHVKQLFFPNWGIEGGLKLRVPQRVVRRNLYR